MLCGDANDITYNMKEGVMSNAIDFSKEEMLEELTQVLLDYTMQLRRIYSGNNINLFGVDVNLPSNEEDIRAEKRNILNFPFGHWMAEAYDYAVHGIMTEDLETDWEVIEEDYFSFIEDVNKSIFFEKNTASGRKFDKCMKVLELSKARALIDFGSFIPLDHSQHAFNHIQISDMAILAGLDERSIRNMTNQNHKNYLKTEKIGNKTYISIDVALEWLVKRGFKKTVMIKKNIDRDIEKFGFLTTVDLAEFFVDNAENMSIPKNKEGKYCFRDIKVTEYVNETIDELFQSKFTFNFDMLTKVADELAINKVHFMKSCFKLHQEVETTELMNKIKNIANEGNA